MVPTLKRPNTLLFFLLLMPFCKPVGVAYYPWLDKFFQIWKVFAILYLMVALVPKCFTARPRRKPLGLIGLGLFWTIYFLGCIRAEADIVSVGTAAVCAFLLILLVDYEIRIGNGEIMLRGMSSIFTLCILAHIISVFFVKAGALVFMEGNQETYFLFGYDNYSAFFLYPMLSIILYYRVLRDGRIGLWGWTLMMAVTLIYIYTASITAAGAGILMAAAFAVRQHWARFRKLLQPKWILLTMAVLLVLICVFEVQNLLASMLTAMEKGITLNSRTIIWDYTLRLIAQRPIFGHGSFTQAQINAFVLYGTTHAHNLILELLLRAGILGAGGYLLFLCGFIRPGKNRKLFQSHAAVLVISLIIQMVLAFMDFYPSILVFYCFMAILYHWEELEQKKTDR